MTDDDDGKFSALAPEEETRLALLLKHAFAPSELDPVRHEQLLLTALEDPFAPASAEELVASERLRRALEDDGSDHPDLILARALSAAHAPSPAAAAAVAPPALPATRRSAGKMLYLRFGGITAALAAAAAVLLAIGTHGRPESSAPELPALALVQSRSTATLFETATAGPPSARIDRIASVRERELRDNRYAMWGVR